MAIKKEIIDELQALLNADLKIRELEGYISITNDGMNEIENLYPPKLEKPELIYTDVHIHSRYNIEQLVKNSDDYQKFLNKIKKEKEDQESKVSKWSFACYMSFSITILMIIALLICIGICISSQDFFSFNFYGFCFCNTGFIDLCFINCSR